MYQLGQDAHPALLGHEPSGSPDLPGLPDVIHYFLAVPWTGDLGVSMAADRLGADPGD